MIQDWFLRSSTAFWYVKFEVDRSSDFWDIMVADFDKVRYICSGWFADAPYNLSQFRIERHEIFIECFWNVIFWESVDNLKSIFKKFQLGVSPYTDQLNIKLRKCVTNVTGKSFIFKYLNYCYFFKLSSKIWILPRVLKLCIKVNVYIFCYYSFTHHTIFFFDITLFSLYKIFKIKFLYLYIYFIELYVSYYLWLRCEVFNY